MQQIIIVEDDQIIREELQIFLSKYGYDIKAPTEFDNIVDYILKQNADLILLDINLPVFDGYYICREIRKTSEVPIIVVTSRDSEVDELMSMNLGADDYLAKPFNPLELVARINAQMRRFYDFGGSKEKQDEKVIIGDLMLDQRECKLYKKDKEIDLTYMEYKLLKLFMTEPGRVFTKAQIFELVWESEYYYTDNTVVVYISKLRDKIEDDSKNPQMIKTVRGLGYRFEK